MSIFSHTFSWLFFWWCDHYCKISWGVLQTPYHRARGVKIMCQLGLVLEYIRLLFVGCTVIGKKRQIATHPKIFTHKFVRQFYMLTSMCRSFTYAKSILHWCWKLSLEVTLSFLWVSWALFTPRRFHSKYSMNYFFLLFQCWSVPFVPFSSLESCW